MGTRRLGLNFENRKYARVFLCKKYGRYIRVSKKKGKIEVICPKCGKLESTSPGFLRSVSFYFTDVSEPSLVIV